MSATLVNIFGPEWADVRTAMIEGQEMYMAHDICKILGLSNVTTALGGVNGSYNVSPQFRRKERVYEWNHRRKIHLLTVEGVFQLILNNKSKECKKIKEYLASEVLPKMLNH